MSLLHEIGALYDSLDDPSCLEGFVDKAATAYSGCNAGIGLVDTDASVGRAYVASNVDPAIQRRYLPVIDREPWFARLLELHSSGGTHLGTNLVKPRDYRKTWFYSNVMRPADVEFMLCSACVSPRYSVFLSINRSNATGDFDSDDLASLNAVRPHLARFGHLIHQQHEMGDVRSLDLPVVELNAQGIAWMNEAAGRLLAKSSSLSIRNGRLRLADKDGDTKLRHVVDRICRHRLDDLPASGLTIPIEGHGHVLLLPSSTLEQSYQRRHFVTLVFLLDNRLSATAIGKEYGLTVAEQQLVAALASGRSLGGHARSTGRSIHTVRSQLKCVFRKTGTHSQALLIRKMAGGI